LHLAVKSVEILKTTRPVRALLLKGANRSAKDNVNKMPIEMVADHLADSLKWDLE